MPKVSPILTNFSSGEFGPLVQARVDSERYKTGLAVCLNYVVASQGPLLRRSGTRFVAEASSAEVYAPRIIEFEFSTTQAYTIQINAEYFRFYKDNALILEADKTVTNIENLGPAIRITCLGHGFSDGDKIILNDVQGMTELNNREFTVGFATGADFILITGDETANVDGSGFSAWTGGGVVARVYELNHSYSQSEIFELKYTQSNDVIYLVHPEHKPRKLSRTGHTSWTIEDIDFQDGPYLPTNTTDTELSPSAATGTSVTVTASSVVGINNDEGFKATDVGRYIRMRWSTTWGWCKIVEYVSSTVVKVDVEKTLTSTSGHRDFRLGVWSDTTGYPSCVVFFEDRLFFGGPTSYPQRLDGSKSSDYENFAPSDLTGTVADDNAVGFSLNANDVNAMYWMTSDEKGLLAGTSGGEWVIKPSSQNEALSPTNISAKRPTKYGSKNVQPVQSGKSTIYVQKSGKKLRDMSYFYEVDGFRSSDLNELADSICGAGITQIAVQNLPQPVVWAVRADGVLLSMTYQREADSFKVAWTRHQLGGLGTYGGPPRVWSVAVIPSADGLSEDVWLVVQRYINGKTVYYVEYLERFFEETDAPSSAYFLDCGLTYDNSEDVLFFDSGDEFVFTQVDHGLSTGDRIYIVSMELSSRYSDMVGKSYDVSVTSSSTYSLVGVAPSDFPAGGDTYSGFRRATVGTYVSVVEGLNHLEGETIQLLGNGAVLPDVTVTNGRIHLSEPVAILQMGYKYNSDGQILRFDAGSADGTAIGKTRRTHRVGFMLHRTGGFKFGLDFDNLETKVFRESDDPVGVAVPLFSGIISEELEADYDFDNQIAWRQDEPLPGTILAVFPQMVTQDGG